MGPSGAGKGSVVAALVEAVPGLWLSRSWTTRPRRSGEGADAYEFVSPESFEEASRAGRFLEEAEVFGHRYGTPLADPPPGQDLLLEIDVQGAAQVRRARPDAVMILVVPPSRQAQEERLHGRGDDPVEIARRVAAAAAEEERGRELADHVVVNDVLERAVAEVAGILAAHRSRRSRPVPGDV